MQEWMPKNFVGRRTKVLAAARLGKKLITGQYNGYRDEEGVDPNSSTLTFVAGDLYVDNWRWKGVPFSLHDW